MYYLSQDHIQVEVGKAPFSPSIAKRDPELEYSYNGRKLTAGVANTT